MKRDIGPTVSFKPSENFHRIVQRLFDTTKRRLLVEFPDADVQDMGATAIPGLLTKGDLDINLRVPAADFATAVAFLKRHYSVHQPQNWNEGFASFVDDDAELPLGLHVTVIGHPEDKFIAQRDRRRSSPGLIEKYNELKRRYEGADAETYRRAKWQFIAQYLESTPDEQRARRQAT